MRDGILKTVDCELQIRMELVEFLENRIHIVGLHHEQGIVYISRIELKSTVGDEVIHDSTLKLCHYNVCQHRPEGGTHADTIYLFVHGSISQEGGLITRVLDEFL